MIHIVLPGSVQNLCPFSLGLIPSIRTQQHLELLNLLRLSEVVSPGEIMLDIKQAVLVRLVQHIEHA